MGATFHPLDPLSAVEISLVSTTIRLHLASIALTLSSHKNAYVTLIEPPKLEVLAFLGISTSPSDLNPISNGILPKRLAESAVIDAVSGEIFVFEVEIEVHGQAAKVIKQTKLEEGVQVGITMEELTDAEQVVRADPRVQKLCADVGIEVDQIVADCWSVGYEERFGPGLRLQQAFVYARLGPDEHLYAHPLDFNCVVDSNAGKVIYIDFASHRVDPKDINKLSGSTAPHSIEKDSQDQCGRERIIPSMERFDYLPHLLEETAKAKGETWEPRQGLKPLHAVQPEGVSFQMDGNLLTWQNWSLHVGFNYREGIVLNTVTYFDKDENRVRPILYRASFAEMVVPYSSPEWPHPRKFALDVGEYGLGMMANSLELGCDCLGAIHYLDGNMSGHDGQPTVIKKAICIHEEDDGLLWKHTDFRPGGKAHAVRSRKLVIQMVVTVANYEYLFAWSLRLDGTIELEIKLTGILNLYTLAEGEKSGAFGTEVAPRVVAHHHQHIFCLRLDPMIDGINNSVVETDVVPLPEPTGSDENWAGNGFIAKKTILQTTGEGARMSDTVKGRMWSLVNEDKVHYASKAPVGFKIMCKDMPPLLAKEDSLVARRTPFATKNLFVSPYVDQQLYPAGKYVTQTLVCPEDSLVGWMKGDKNIAKTDLVAWFTFGVTHIPRPEDFPVMPSEHISFVLKPVGFFKQNPALDVPASADSQSVNAFDIKLNGTNGKCCK